LESLMGKEFKHPRRQCKICGYSVSYSNFKRHLRNAHPGEADDSPMEGVEMMMEMEMREGMIGHPMDDQQDLDREDGSVEIKEGYVECNKCGDVVLADQLPVHTHQIHGNEGINKESTISITPMTKGSSPRPRNIIMRACPVCGVEMRSDSIPKHCKMKHKVSYRYCSACSKYVQKKYYKSHVRKHDTSDVVEPGEEPEDLDTSKDGEDEEEEDEAMDTSTTQARSPPRSTTAWTARECSCLRRRTQTICERCTGGRAAVWFSSCLATKKKTKMFLKTSLSLMIHKI